MSHRLLALLLLPALAAASRRASSVVFSLIGHNCLVPPNASSHQSFTYSRRECRMLCASDPSCAAVHASLLPDGRWKCVAIGEVDGGNGQCLENSCCYFKGVPPEGIQSFGSMLAADDEMAVQPSAKGATLMSTPVLIVFTLNVLVLAFCLTYCISRNRRLHFIPPTPDERQMVELRQRVAALPTTTCKLRGVAPLPDDESTNVCTTKAEAQADSSQAPPSTASDPAGGDTMGGAGRWTLVRLVRRMWRHVRRRVDLPHKSVGVLAKQCNQSDDLEAGSGRAYGEDECALCMNLYEPKETIRHLPCHHYFHAACIDRWLTGGVYRTCPLCKADPLPPILGQDARTEATAVETVVLQRPEGAEHEQHAANAANEPTAGAPNTNDVRASVAQRCDGSDLNAGAVETQADLQLMTVSGTIDESGACASTTNSAGVDPPEDEGPLE